MFFLISANSFAQTEYVLSDNKVYDFLERMESLQLIERYNSLEIPKSRSEIAGYLKEVIANPDQLDEADKELLNDLEAEFELELFRNLKKISKILSAMVILISCLRGKNIFTL